MIITRLRGGLGNQMFQYALGRHLSLSKNIPLKFDVQKKTNSFYIVEDYRYCLEAFNIDIKNNQASDKYIEDFRHYKQRTGALAFITNILWADKNRYVQEKSRGFGADFPDNNFYLEGFWQSELYFKESRETLLKDFSLQEYLTGTDAELEKDITSSHAISLHIRRQDYANNTRTKNKHGLLTETYYNRALEKLLGLDKTPPKLFVFSDDIEWVKKNMDFGHKTAYAEGAIDTPHRDIYLMSKCVHNIVANSSFSWWGAWLNQNPDKIVIAPEKWLVQASDEENRRRIPPDWLTVSPGW